MKKFFSRREKLNFKFRKAVKNQRHQKGFQNHFKITFSNSHFAFLFFSNKNIDSSSPISPCPITKQRNKKKTKRKKNYYRHGSVHIDEAKKKKRKDIDLRLWVENRYGSFLQSNRKNKNHIFNNNNLFLLQEHIYSDKVAILRLLQLDFYVFLMQNQLHVHEKSPWRETCGSYWCRSLPACTTYICMRNRINKNV